VFRQSRRVFRQFRIVFRQVGRSGSSGWCSGSSGCTNGSSGCKRQFRSFSYFLIGVLSSSSCRVFLCLFALSSCRALFCCRVFLSRMSFYILSACLVFLFCFLPAQRRLYAGRSRTCSQPSSVSGIGAGHRPSGASRRFAAGRGGLPGGSSGVWQRKWAACSFRTCVSREGTSSRSLITMRKRDG
jgi:hypothetical protein